MYVGVLSITLQLHGVDNLKAKRRIIKQIKDRASARFNCSVAEVGELDRHQSAELGFSVVSNEGAHANAQLDKIADFVEGVGDAVVVSRSLEVLSVKGE